MLTVFFLLLFSLLALAYLTWGVRVLPRERWQILASVPLKRQDNGEWSGVNLTFYGLLTANAYAIALATLVVLLRSLHLSLAALLLLAFLLLALCVPASRAVARWVEGKAHTFTVGGAVFVGILAAPWLVGLVNLLLWQPALPLRPTLAALAIAYAFGEGFGRLACISFGCCYGKPLSACSPRLQRLFHRFHLVFEGQTKKIAYADGLHGCKVVPVQALTAFLYVGTGLIATALFLLQHYGTAFLLPALVTQGWRIASELLRADYRGEQRFSAYQWMGLFSLFYVSAVALWAPAAVVGVPDLAAGLTALWRPEILLSLALLWWTLFLYTGCSSVTGVALRFHVRQERI
ncbi:MAG: prolipoprotein diacylglyceryl transferase [Desulfuromonadaceae bacterium]|nr:prolipoprotein diacylglyceryl transferase [Desulfuromonadaceae bacterium]